MSLPQPPAPTEARCPRHPDRDAWRRCTRCGRPACNECLVQASIGSQCRDCARAGRPSVGTRVRYASAAQPILMTYALMAINIGIFVLISIQDPRSLQRTNLAPPRPDRLDQIDLGLRAYEVAGGEWYRVVSSGFLHFGVIHLAFNMLLLFQLGRMLEPAIGRVRFALLYFAALLAGSAGAIVMQPDQFHGGASGAVFGLMAAAAIGLRRRGVNPFNTAIGTTLLLNLVLTFSIPGISIGGHIGGAIGGLIAGWFMLAPQWRRPAAPWLSYVAPVAVMGIALAVTWVAVQ